jgi:chorismate mutase
MADDQSALAELHDIRNSIDNIDAAMIYILSERFRRTQRIGVLTAHHNLPSVDPAREEIQIIRLCKLAETARLDPEFAEKYLAFIVREVIHHHEMFPRNSMN